MSPCLTAKLNAALRVRKSVFTLTSDTCSSLLTLNCSTIWGVQSNRLWSQTNLTRS
jgi:hypothetical protein